MSETGQACLGAADGPHAPCRPGPDGRQPEAMDHTPSSSRAAKVAAALALPLAALAAFGLMQLDDRSAARPSVSLDFFVQAGARDRR